MIFLIPFYGWTAKAENTDKKNEESSNKTNRFLLLRDPFKAPTFSTGGSLNEEILQKYSLNELKLLGVITGLKSKKALIITPDNKSYFVEENTKIGRNRGVLLKIYPERVVIREEIFNGLGEWEPVHRELALSPAKQSFFSVAKAANDDRTKKEVSESNHEVEKNGL
jgi:Tfp pilus assembly protein PilP